MVGEGVPGVGTPPLARSGWWGGTQATPRLCLDSAGGGVYRGVPSPHSTEQYSEHLLRGGRYASCVHAGGLSCVNRNWSCSHTGYCAHI